LASSANSRHADVSVAIPALMRKRVERLRYRGYAGGVIPRHRALLVLPMDPRTLWSAIALAVGLTVIWLAVTDWVSRIWSAMLATTAGLLSLDVPVRLFHYHLGDIYSFAVPYLPIIAGAPDGAVWWASLWATVLVALASFFVSRNYVPLIYWMRLVAIIQASALVFFAWSPDAFPYNAGGYQSGMMAAGLALITLIPLAFGFTYYMFDVGFFRKLLLTLAAMLHLGILIPLQYLLQAYILHLGSLLYMPVLFVVFGLPLDVFAIVAFYAWGMSWSDRERRT
jgi:hypothetical protein